MKMQFVPTTILGKWSVRLIGFFAVMYGMFMVFVSIGERGGDAFFSNPKLAVPMVLAVLCAIAALIIGVFAVMWKQERSPVVFLVMGIGLLVLVFVLAEILFSH